MNLRVCEVSVVEHLGTSPIFEPVTSPRHLASLHSQLTPPNDATLQLEIQYSWSQADRFLWATLPDTIPPFQCGECWIGLRTGLREKDRPPRWNVSRCRGAEDFALSEETVGGAGGKQIEP